MSFLFRSLYSYPTLYYDCNSPAYTLYCVSKDRDYVIFTFVSPVFNLEPDTLFQGKFKTEGDDPPICSKMLYFWHTETCM